MPLSQEARAFIEGSRGISRREIKAGAQALGLKGVTDRQIINVQKGATPERLASQARQQGRTRDRIQESWIKNAKKRGIDTRIRGNKAYQDFRKQILKQDKLYKKIAEGMMSRKDWVVGRLNIYHNAGLIDDEEYDKYIKSLK